MNYVVMALTSFAVCCVLTAISVPLLRKLKAGQNILHYVKEHSSKQGTPTMGGIAFIVTIAVTSLVFGNTGNRVLLLTVSVFVGYAVVGFLDDFIKIKLHHNEGLLPYQKIVAQLAIAVIVAIFAYGDPSVADKIRLPFSDKHVNVGTWIVPLTVFIFVACSNGVNLTDGLDGLATSTSICYFAGMIVLIGNEIVLCENTGDTYGIDTCTDMLVVCWVAVGALTAFLLFNVYPAKVFMGDVGSLSLGALVACVSIFSRHSLFIPILGLMFVTSCVSVIVQVGYYKISHGKRVFLMAPFHHHLQKKGWSEPLIALTYCVVTVLCCALLVVFGG